jgi:hypothetical protein
MPCRCLESLLADGQCGHAETSFRLSTLNEGQQPKHQLVITIVLINGCFHNGPEQLHPTISVNTMAFFKKNEDYLKLKLTG